MPRLVRPSPEATDGEPARRSPLPLAVLEFESPSAAIIATPVPALSRATNLLVFLLVVSVLAASAVIRIDKIVSAKGKLIADAPNIVMQPFDQSIVESIEREKGQPRPQGPGARPPQPDLHSRRPRRDEGSGRSARTPRPRACRLRPPARITRRKNLTRMPPCKPRSSAEGRASMSSRCRPMTRGLMSCKPKSSAIMRRPTIFASASASLPISRACARSFWHCRSTASTTGCSLRTYD